MMTAILLPVPTTHALEHIPAISGNMYL